MAQPVSVLYSPHGDNAGHYDCVLESAVSVTMISPTRPTSVSRQKLGLAAKRKARKTEAEIITSSPYKRKLEVSQAKQKPTKKTSKSKPNTENRAKQKAKNKRSRNVSHQQEANWFCFLCQECREEDMIQCLMCSKWVHVDCAGITESQREHFCDVC